MKTNRIISLILTALLLAATFSVFSLASGADGESPIKLFMLDENNGLLDPETGVEGTNGDTFTVKIKAAGVSATCTVHGFQFRLTYDATKLQPEEDGATIYVDEEYSAILYKEGYIEFLWTASSGTRLTKSGKVIAEASFRMIAPGSSEIAVVADTEEGDGFYRVDGIVDDEIVMTDYPLNGVVSGTSTTCCSVPVTAAVDIENDFCFSLSADPTPLNLQATVGITMNNPPVDLYGFSLEVNYDPAKLSFVSGTLDAQFPYGRILCSEAGKVRVFAATDVDAPASVTTGMAQLVFEIVDPDKAEGSAYDLSISFYNGQPTYTRVNHQTIAYTDVPTVGATLTLLAAEEVPYDPFDLNRDGDVTVADVSALLDYIAGVGILPDGVEPDLNQSGEVTVADVSALLDYVASL